MRASPHRLLQGPWRRSRRLPCPRTRCHPLRHAHQRQRRRGLGTLRRPRRLAQHHSPAAGGPAITRLESALAGARLYLVDGLISDAGRQVAEAVAQQGLFDASTLKGPIASRAKDHGV